MNGSHPSQKRGSTVLFISIMLACAVVSSLTHISVFSTQPPIDTTDHHLTHTDTIELDITHSIVCTYTPSPYNATYIYKGQMRIGCIDIGGLIGNADRAYYKFLVHVTRADMNPNVEILSTSIILKRVSGTTWALPNSTTILLAGGASQTVELAWGETGGGVTSTMGTWVGRAWTIGALALCTNTTAYDNNMANNEIMTGGTYNAYTGLETTGDINGDGVIDIWDAIRMSGIFGLDETSPDWNPDANLSHIPEPSTGRQCIDIFDAIMFVGVMRHFGSHMP